MMSAATLIVEVVLTKFLGIKLFYHFVYAILGMVVFSFALAGTIVYLRKDWLGKDISSHWRRCGYLAAAFGVTLPLGIVAFCAMPLDVVDWNAGDVLLRSASLILILLLLGLPLTLAGACISHVLSASRLKVTTVYFFDLLAAAIGAALSPFLLAQLGGYGCMALGAILGLLSAVAFQVVSQSKISRVVLASWTVAAVATTLLLIYPSWSVARFGFDIRSTKDPEIFETFMQGFGGLRSTHWNAIARTDVSNQGTSENRGVYKMGISDKVKTPVLPGRMIMVDGAANTRQFLVDGDVTEQDYLRKFVWVSPYIAHSAAVQDALVLGGGGGIDILIAKYFRVPHVDVVEFNPATAAILQGRLDDPDGRFSRPLLSDDKTSVNIINKEVRHFCTTVEGKKYDVIQASGVDTLTAITTGGLANTDNYLYTTDAVAAYARLLKPGGILSLTHWRTLPPLLPLRMFLSYIEYLEKSGVKDAYRQVLVVGGDRWTASMLKTTPFTREEVANVRKWATENGQYILFDPFAQPEKRVSGNESEATYLLFDPYKPAERSAGANASEAIFYDLAFAGPQKRAQLIDDYPRNISPVSDNKPYFYNTQKWAMGSNIVINVINTLALLMALLVAILPARGVNRTDLRKEVIPYLFFFAFCGFAFFLFETMIIQTFTIVMGGPIYSLSVALVSVLSGYALGSGLAGRLSFNGRTIAVIGILLCVLFVASYFLVPTLIASLLPLSLSQRLLYSAVVIGLLSIAAGIPVSLTMNHLREKQGGIVCWMWGISSAFNALAAIGFIPIAQLIGIAEVAMVVAVLYLSGALILAAGCRRQSA
jgi:spermidine synthase